MNKFLFRLGLVLAGIIALPSLALAAYNTVTFTSNTDLYLWGVPITLTVSSGSLVADFTVNSTTLDLSMENGSTITITSADKKILKNNLGAPTTCGTSASTLSIASGSTQGVSIDIGETCPSGSAVISTGGGGGGGGTPEPAPKKEAAKPSAAEKPISQMTVLEVKAKIAEITQLIVQLQAQLVAMLGGQQVSGPAVSGAAISQNLKLGDEGDGVRTLQTWLAKDPAVYPEAKITGYFGPLTKQAVIRFQEKYKAEILDPWKFTKGTGYVGSSTRAKLNALYAGQ